jgi:histone H3/H4
MEGIRGKQLTETRVEVMFREIVVGQELVNKDLLESMRERLEEKLAQIQEDMNNLADDQR